MICVLFGQGNVLIEGQKILPMAECAAVLSCINLRSRRSCIKTRGIIYRTYSYENRQCVHLPTWKMCKLSTSDVSNFRVSPCPRESALRCSCLGTLINVDGAAASDWIPVFDQVLLMASAFLTYMAGVAPAEKPCFKPRINDLDDGVVSENTNFSGSAMKNGEQVKMKYAWDVVKGKLMDSLNAIEFEANLGNKVNELDQHEAKQPLSLQAVAKGPRLRLLWASFQQLEKEVNNISGDLDAVSVDSWLKVSFKVIQSSFWHACIDWLEKEFSLKDSHHVKELLGSMFKKLKIDETILQNIQKSGKKDLYAELLCFLRFSSLRKDCCYDNSLFVVHGVAILEDLLITLADGIASIYLELISVDGNMPNEMNSQSLILCTLSTRALQRLRNEVALNLWLHQNIDAVVSMYEDRFDLCTFQSQQIEGTSHSHPPKFSLWERLTQKESQSASPPFHYIVIRHFSMPVKRTRELRSLNGWRYYFSLFLELSDITMPLIRVVFAKFRDAISFFLVYLIGRSLGLIYTGIRQSLWWK
ncbi:uncharacterized protein LOC131156315 [Malania oleifera]|uniref:uncharacterized protein LOC131156315 n=1 Tax=Malania oleifera TaxID=397392 RepID=UPI0025AEBF43|nr:uncharacterized protein LOC131156315 [Malania oleifera]